MSASFDIFKMANEKGLRKHKGRCHCGLVRFEVVAPVRIVVYECSCESCWRRQFKYFEVELGAFNMVAGHQQLDIYDSGRVRHSFCRTCGIQCFCIFCSKDGAEERLGVMPNCIDPGTMTKIKIDRTNTKKMTSDACCQPHAQKPSR